MRIGFMLPGIYAFTHAANGVRVQAELQRDALRSLGHEVVELNPWTHFNSADKFDVVHYFSGGMPMFRIQFGWPNFTRMLAWAPILDTNEPLWRYRLATKLGTSFPKIYTIPGEMKRQADACKLVICRSKNEQTRVVKGMGVPEWKTRVVLNGINPPPPGDPALARELLGFDGPFVLHVSAYWQARKNVVRLIEAVGPTGIPLVIAGNSEKSAVLDRIIELEQKYKNVKRLGFLTAEQLNALNAACRVFAMPSENEGTGLAALEAAAQGAAVVITDRGGTRDYFQNFAHFVNPDDTQSIRTAIETAFSRPADPAFRTHVLTELTWEQSARSLIAAYQALADAPT
ncbi:MAG: glycosyltransferase [Tepidisphaeraceae bacterium]